MTTEALDTLEDLNRPTLDRLRLVAPTLTDSHAHHYVDLLHRLIAERRGAVACKAPSEESSDTSPEPVGEESAPSAIDIPKRVRDKQHLAFVARQACAVCGRAPAQVHHLTFAQPKAMSRKAGDQWTVPLCALHHRDVHDAGDERAWWKRRRIDAEETASRLWRDRLSAGARDPSAA